MTSVTVFSGNFSRCMTMYRSLRSIQSRIMDHGSYLSFNHCMLLLIVFIDLTKSNLRHVLAPKMFGAFHKISDYDVVFNLEVCDASCLSSSAVMFSL